LQCSRATTRAFRRWRRSQPKASLQTDHDKRLGFHDLRATGITWRAVRGDAMQAIKEHAGHEDVGTTDGYCRTATNLRAGFGNVFPALPAALLRAPIGP